MIINGLEWDSGNWPKCGKHGVSKSEIEALFHSNPKILFDPHSDETRWRAIGKADNGHYIYAVFTVRDNMLRPISARYMHKREIEKYEEI